MPDHNTHGVGFKRMRMAGLLPAAALILAVFAPSTVSAAEVKLAGAVVSGLFYSKAESAEHSNLVLAGVGEAPDDTCFKILGKEDLGNGYYVRFNLSSNATASSAPHTCRLAISSLKSLPAVCPGLPFPVIRIRSMLRRMPT